MFDILSSHIISKVSAKILKFHFYFLTVLGLIGFGVRRKDGFGYGLLVTYDRFWLKWCAICLRVLLCSAFIYGYIGFISKSENLFELLIRYIRVTFLPICAAIIIRKQICKEYQILSTMNAFFRIFWRFRTLSKRANTGFGGEFELFLLLIMSACLTYEFCGNFAYFVEKKDIYDYFFVISIIYMNTAKNSIFHICFIGYLSVNVLYTEFNNYLGYDFADKLKSLEIATHNNRLKKASKELDKCLALYEDIQRVATKFHRLMEIPLLVALASTMSSIALIVWKFIFSPFLWNKVVMGFVIMQTIDIIILSFAVDKAIESSRLIRNLSFEIEFIWQHRELEMTMEMFLGRLHLKQFRVQVLGIFDISNRFILVCLSAIVTIITIVLQMKLGEANNK